MIDLKYQIGIALIALLQVLTHWASERRARERADALNRGLRQVQDSLRPPAPAPELDFEGEETPCQAHVWVPDDSIGDRWKCKRCGLVRVTA